MQLDAAYRALVDDKQFREEIQRVEPYVAQLVALIAARQATRRRKTQGFQCLSLIAAYRPFGAAFGRDKPAPPRLHWPTSITHGGLVEKWA